MTGRGRRARTPPAHGKPAGATCRVALLGGFRVEAGGRMVAASAWHHRRAADVVKLLAMAPRHRLHREQVMDALWPRLGPRPAGANLRKAVHYARTALGSQRAVVHEGAVLVLWPDGRLTVDVDLFEADARRAAAGDPSAAAAAKARYAGELLPDDAYEPWTVERREGLRLNYLATLRAAADWPALAEADPADEQAGRELMATFLAAGRSGAAIQQYERLRKVLRDELGVSPDDQTTQLYERALEGRAPEARTPAERTGALLATGMMHCSRGEFEEAAQCARQARTLAIDARLGRELGEASALLGMVNHMRGQWRQTFRHEFESLIEAAPKLVSWAFDAHVCLAEFALHGGDGHDDMIAFAQDLGAMARRRRHRHGQAVAALMAGEAELLAGRLDAAGRALASAVELHRRAGTEGGLALSLQRLAEVFLRSAGGKSRAAALLREALPYARASSLSAHLVVRIHETELWLRGGTGRAASTLERAEQELAGISVCQPCSVGFDVAAATIAARAGDLARAARHLEAADRTAGMWPGGPWHAAVWEARGELRLAEGKRGQARALFGEAAERFAGAGRPLDESRCRRRMSA